jgi:20S proteasome subunit alpha 6
MSHVPLGGPPGRGSGRGAGAAGGRGGRGGPMSGNRGGIGGRGSRGGSSTYIGGGGGGRGGGGQGGGALKAHGSRGGFGNRDFRRGGGSFSAGPGGHSHHQQNSSFRNRGQGHSNSSRGRHDSAGTFGTRDGSMSLNFNSSGKKDENRRTLTDFKIVGLQIPDLDWTWGVVPSQCPRLPSPIKTETSVTDILPRDQIMEKNNSISEAHTDNSSQVVSEEAAIDGVPPTSVNATRTASAAAIAPPPSRIRIYFHTPVSMDDSQPMAHTSSLSIAQTPSDSRKGKRKKLEDDDGDIEEGRGRRPPPQMGSSINDDRSSVAASVDMDGMERESVAETASENDWLMAAIVGEDGSGGTEHGFDTDGDGDDDKLHVSRIVGISNDSNVPGVGDDISEYNGEHSPLVESIVLCVDNPPLHEDALCGRDTIHAANILS